MTWLMKLMNMKTLKRAVITGLTVIGIIIIAGCAALLAFLLYRPSASDFDPSSFSLEHEPDNIFASDRSDRLLVCIDGEIREYRPDGIYYTLEIDRDIAEIKSVYPGERTMTAWYIDTNDRLYHFVATEATPVLENVKSFSVDGGGCAAVLNNGDIYFRNGKNENPLCVGNVPNAEKIAFGYEYGHYYALVSDAEGQVYECVFPADVSGSREFEAEFKKIDELNSVEDIYAGYGNIAVTKSGEVHYWFDSFGSGRKSPNIDAPSDIEQKCNELGLIKFSSSPEFCAGYNKNGEVYFWGTDRFRNPNDKSVKHVSSPERIKFIKSADDIFAGSGVLYIKTGTTITVLKNVY